MDSDIVIQTYPPFALAIDCKSPLVNVSAPQSKMAASRQRLHEMDSIMLFTMIYSIVVDANLKNL